MQTRWQRIGQWGQVRFSSSAQDSGIAAAGAQKDLAAGMQAATRVAEQRMRDAVQTAYPRLDGVTTSHRVTKGGAFVNLKINDDHFSFMEYDTEPHWPPFGKCTPLYAWAVARGLAPFAVAWGMAPVSPTGATCAYCVEARGKQGTIMNMSGSGGKQSKRYPGRLVATQGKYVVTDLMPDIEAFLDIEFTRLVNLALNRLQGGP